MLENIVDALINRVRDEVVQDENMTNIPLGYLGTRNIPDSVKHFFDQEVEIWIREEEEKFSATDKFDYDMPEVRMLIDKIFDVLKQNANFHITKFNQLLERAVKLEMNYLISPHRTLTQFIFKNSQIVSTMEVYDTFKYFFRYEYYKIAISDYFNTKYMREISQDQFKDLMDQIDNKAFSENKFEMALKTVKAIVGFVGEAIEEQVDVISLEVLKVAFEDRNLSDYSQLIEDLQNSGQNEITLSDLENLLREGSAGKPVETAVAPESKSIIEELEDIEESKPSVEVEGIDLKEMEVVPETDLDEEIEEDEEEEELEEETATTGLKFHDDEEIEVTPEAETDLDQEEPAEEPVEETEVLPEKPVVETPPAPQPPKPAKSGAVADELANFVASKIKSDSPLEDINNFITGKNRKRIIKKLYKRKEDHFIKFISLLNEQTNWKEASVVIDEEFYQKGINPYSKEALLFSDLIYMRFFPKDKYVGEQSNDDKF